MIDNKIIKYYPIFGATFAIVICNFVDYVLEKENLNKGIIVAVVMDKIILYILNVKIYKPNIQHLCSLLIKCKKLERRIYE